MKKHALALATSALLLAPAAALAAGPTLYGQLNVTLDQVDTDTGVAATSTKVWQLNSNSSRLGVKGDAETGIQDLKALYFLEYGVDADDASTAPFTQRNIYAGLQGGFGTLRLGKIDSPLKDSQGKVDQFNDLAGDIQNLFAGENRNNNSIYYSSPKLLEALTLNLAVYPGEGADIDNADGDANTGTDAEDGIADALSSSIVWDKGAIYAALAYDQNASATGHLDGFTDINGATAGNQSVANILRATFVYKADVFEVGALYTTAEDASDDPVDGEDAAWLLSGAYKNGPWKIKAQYGVNDGDTTSDSKTLTAIGADYSLGKSTTVLAYLTSVALDDGAPANIDTEVTTLGVGLLQKF